MALQAVIALVKSLRPYSIYVLVVLMIVFLLNQLDRFVLGIASKSLARDLKFGSSACSLNTSILDSVDSNGSNVSTACITTCNGIKNQSECLMITECMWDYSATGIQYEVLAGPAFTLVFTLTAIPLGVLAGSPKVNRRIAIAVCLTLWSGMTLAASFTHTYWQLLLTRMGLGIFEAVCTPFASSIISDLFSEHYRATALGFYNWGIYIGYSVAFAFNFILISVGWRWTFRAAALPGFLMSIVMLLTVREPEHHKYSVSPKSSRHKSFIVELLKSLLKPSLLVLCLAGGIRQGGGLVWSYNVKSYFSQYYCASVNVGIYLSWVPLVGGTLGALLGGLVSDRLVRRKGQSTRLWVLIVSQLLAAPFLIGAVLLPPDPWAFLCLLPAYIVGEVWIGVSLAIVIEMVPRRVVAAAVAVFLFAINNIGGLLPLLIPPLQAMLNLRYTLLFLFPGSYVVSAALFALSLIIITCGKICPTDICQSSPEEVVTERDLLIQVEDSQSDLDADESHKARESLITSLIVRT